ncbi:MAG: SurA N-terminal domain-containing protein [Candidatus Omnitrophica bacterium]|nr:SurA N-terminal domain-containing protein [Candidatus Omnitrophota bacterium]
MVLRVLRSKKFARRTLLAVLILILPAFVLWGIGSFSERPDPIGTIGSQKIFPDTFEKSRQGMRVQFLLTFYGDYNTLTEYLKNRPLLNYMAWERLILLTAARKSGVTATNKDVMNFITSHPLFQKNGVFNKELYQYILSSALGLEPRSFEELVRENLTVQAFRKDKLKDITVTEEEVVENYKKNNEQMVLAYIILYKELYDKDLTASPEEIKDVYEKNKDGFISAEKIEVDYIEFPFGNAEEKDIAIAKSKEMFEALRKSPEKYPDIAKDYKLEYGRTGLFSQEEVIPQVKFFKGFSDAAFSLKKGQISPPIFPSTDKGAGYIMRKINEVSPKQLTFDEVKDDIKSMIIERDSLKIADEKAKEFYKEITEKGATLEKIAPEIKQEVKFTEKFTVNDYIENLGPAKNIAADVKKGGKGKMLSPLLTRKGVILARVEEILPADMEKLKTDTDKEKARNDLLLYKQAKKIEEWFDSNPLRVELKKDLSAI